MKNWICADSDSCQYVADLGDSVYEFYEVIALTHDDGDDCFAVVHGHVHLMEYLMDEESIAKILQMYEYDSIRDVMNEYGVDWRQIIAECIFETHAREYRHVIVGTFEFCAGYITAMTEKEAMR